MTPEQKAAKLQADREALDYALELYFSIDGKFDSEMSFGQFLQWLEMRSISKRLKELRRTVSELPENSRFILDEFIDRVAQGK